MEENAQRLRVRHPIDCARFPAVVFESDDWGACEVAPTAAVAAALEPRWEALYGQRREIHTTLETPEDLRQLYAVLSGFRGADGQPAVFTAFTCTGAPDYEAIRATGYSEYRDIGIDEGVPPTWERGDLVSAWREGMRLGVYSPEFHGRLHHTSPLLLLQRLRGAGPEAELARFAFDREVYCQGAHLPEFAGMNVRAQYDWNRVGIERFRRAFGRPPAAAVTSDAYPDTETIWALLGIRTVCLKSCRVNSGQVVVYGTKPWNNQDPSVPMGAYHPMRDLVYLTRNVFFECANKPDQSAEVVCEVIRTRWSEGEPAVISTHRANYVSFEPERAQTGRIELSRLLRRLTEADGVRFLTSAELGDIFRQGWSRREVAGGAILRVWAEQPDEIRVSGAGLSVRALPEGPAYAGIADGADTVFELPPGDYLLCPTA